ncbi:protein of unknown function DUF6, transmembrane [Desulforamulus reducens MI-1]|uniref:EamA domain-containing protein n=1 Tax=Desulforamulus reducens (strain ATCC BAA-1160 / DSM 100696 / MI-1) TaxID=349161 RepID=A4J1C3_DESRM|nr:DMT family transporter [Desulforamulus reducens]ABO48876.1 protein of unknown function DUF6, transmembrane [Desulforamulus reducens MI-1]
MSAKRVYILMVLAALFWSGAFITGKLAVREFPPFALTFFRFSFALPFVLWEKPLTYLPNATTEGWLAILYMAVFASVLGYLFQLIAIQNIGAPKAAIFINLVPVFTIMQSLLFLGEPFSWFKMLSACIIVTGVYLTTRPESGVKEAAGIKA